jgi:hypothetical protein
MRRAWRRAGASAAGTRHWHLDEAREKKRWLRAKIPEIDNNRFIFLQQAWSPI